MMNGASRSHVNGSRPVKVGCQEMDLTVTLAVAGFATICVSANTSTGTAGLLPFFPAFLLNSGLRSAATEARGMPRARRLENREAGVAVNGVYDHGELNSFTYIGNAADGWSLNYGNVVGINDDGTADGSLQATFALTAGDYSLFIGGADIAGTNFQTYGFDVSLTVVPEPSIALLVALGAAVLPRRRRGIFSRGAGSGLP